MSGAEPRAAERSASVRNKINRTPTETHDATRDVICYCVVHALGVTYSMLSDVMRGASESRADAPPRDVAELRTAIHRCARLARLARVRLVVHDDMPVRVRAWTAARCWLSEMQ